jgi:septal ring factor EnvC (AmiA/AmiB activator)
MNENCKDCVQVRNLEDKIKSVWNAINESKDQLKDHESRIKELEVNKGETTIMLQNIKETTERIEQSIKSMETEISSLKSQPNKNYEKFKWIIITALASSIVGAVFGFIAKMK